MPITELMRWMADEERTIGYVARSSGIDVDRLIDILTGAVPADGELERISAMTGIVAEDLQGQDPDGGSEDDRLDPLRCYTVAEAASLMGVSPDTVRAEMKGGRHRLRGDRRPSPPDHPRRTGAAAHGPHRRRR